MERNTMERCQYLYDEFKKAMNDLKEHESLQEELRRVNERGDKIFSEWIQDGQRVESYTTTMENHMSGLERSMVRIKASIATMDIQQKASELRRKEEFSVLRETVTSVGRDVGNGIQIMKGLFQRVQGVNAMLLQLQNEVYDVFSTGECRSLKSVFYFLIYVHVTYTSI
jgi:hypothetical protein